MMTPAAQQVFTKLVTREGMLYPATSVRPMRADKSALRRLKRQAERRYRDATPMGGKGEEG